MSVAASNRVVLVVDDEPLILDLVRSALEDAWFATRLADDGEAAIAHLEAEEAQGLSAIVTDIGLGPSAGGWELARRARELRPGLPVVYMTGDSAHEWTSEGVPLSVVITKPFAPAQIVVAVANLLNAASDAAG